MRELPDRPDLDQLRHQARERQRSAGTTLTLAQLTIAREHGFSSWARLKAEVVRRRSSPDIRPVGSMSELTAVFDWIGERSTPRYAHDDRRFRELADRFPEDAPLMLALRERGQIVGALLACRRGDAVTPRAIGLALPHPVGEVAHSAGGGRMEEESLTRLLQALESAARRLGADQIYEGGVVEPRPLYERLGYRGRNPMIKHLLPLPGRARDRRLQAATLERRSP
jgi:hypothetical protein